MITIVIIIIIIYVIIIIIVMIMMIMMMIVIFIDYFLKSVWWGSHTNEENVYIHTLACVAPTRPHLLLSNQNRHATQAIRTLPTPPLLRLAQSQSTAVQ